MTNIKFNLFKKFLNSNSFVYLFFLIYLVIGLTIYADYGISTDEPFNRMNGLISLKYVIDKLALPIDLSHLSIEIPDFKSYSVSSNKINIIYGVIFDLPLALIEVLFNIQDTRDIYLVKHLINFIVFFVSIIFFYLLINYHFKNNFLSIIGVLILILSPRIFAQSFYNPKDIIFLSLMIFATFFNLKLLNYNGIKFIILATLFAALASGVRVVGCYLPFLTIIFYFLNYDKKKHKLSEIKFLFIYLFLFFIFLFLSWPYLWENPLLNFINSFKLIGNLDYPMHTLYLGEFVNAKYIPWHYFFVWFFISTPPFFLFLILLGIYLFMKNFLQNFLSIDPKNNVLLWKNDIERVELFIFLLIIIPIFTTILFGSTLYNGWRHLYFIYPFMIFISIKGILFLYDFSKNHLRKIFNLLIIFQILFLLNFLVSNHPIQFVYFNFLSKNLIQNNFSYDYWGVANKVTLEKLLNDKDIKKPIKISTASYTDLNKTKFIMTNQQRKNLIILGTENKNADFIFTNYYYNYDPKTEKKFQVPNNYHSITKLEVNGLIINEVFKRKGNNN